MALSNLLVVGDGLAKSPFRFDAVPELRIANMTPSAPKNATTQKTTKAAELPVGAESVVMLLAMVGVACSTGGIDPSLTLVGELPPV